MMNRMLTFPLTIMAVIVLIGMMSGETISGATWNSGTYNGTSLSSPAISMTVASIAIFIGVVVLSAIASGIGIFGSGLKDTAVLIVFKAAAFMGLWTILTVFAVDKFAGAGDIGNISYLGLTLMYAIGFFTHIRGGSDG